MKLRVQGVWITKSIELVNIEDYHRSNMQLES